MAYKLGLHDPRPGAIPLRFATYLHHSALPTPPETFGRMDMVKNWGMLGNDEWGDCAIAGPLHQIMLNCAESGTSVSIDTDAALRNYSEITNFDENAGPSGENPTDNGTSIDAMAKAWLKTGLADSDGKRHKIVAFVDLNPGDTRELWTAMYLFGSVGLGFALPDSAQDQTANREAWDVVPGANIVGGHYVPAFNKLSTEMNCGVSWGNPQPFTTRFYRTYNNQGVVALDEEMLTNMRSLEGFDDAQLRDDIRQVQWL
jgi:hypothetical protein